MTGGRAKRAKFRLCQTANPAARPGKSVIAPLHATSRILRAANETDRIPRVLVARWHSKYFIVHYLTVPTSVIQIARQDTGYGTFNRK